MSDLVDTEVKGVFDAKGRRFIADLGAAKPRLNTDRVKGFFPEQQNSMSAKKLQRVIQMMFPRFLFRNAVKRQHRLQSRLCPPRVLLPRGSLVNPFPTASQSANQSLVMLQSNCRNGSMEAAGIQQFPNCFPRSAKRRVSFFPCNGIQKSHCDVGWNREFVGKGERVSLGTQFYFGRKEIVCWRKRKRLPAVSGSEG